MIEPEFKSPAFRQAELRSECTRITALLSVLAGLLGLVVARGLMSLAHGHRGQAWPFALLLALMTAYETVWLRFVKRAIRSNQEVSSPAWTISIFLESLLPAGALLLLVRTSLLGPERALASPAALAYFLFIILSTLHLSPGLSRLAGASAAIGYTFVSVYTFVRFPDITPGQELMVYANSFSYAVFLLIGGFAAGAVARQIRLHVVAALGDAESRAKIAELERELEIARSIQQGLLPKTPPRIDGFDIAGWNRPAAATGGDYYDWQQLANGQIAITVADVTGHGIGPALAMAACRAYARAGLAAGPALQNLLDRLNQLLYEDLPPEKFVTLATGLLDPPQGSLQLISAGHGPLLFYSSAEGSFQTYDAQGPPLGLLPSARYGCPQRLTFASGDMLVLVTDGFIEWANANNDDFGEDRLKEVIRANCAMPSATIISKLYSAVVQHAGSIPQADDLTALVVKRA